MHTQSSGWPLTLYASQTGQVESDVNECEAHFPDARWQQVAMEQEICRPGFFHKIFGGGTCFRGTIFGPRHGWSQMGGYSCQGWIQMKGDLEKLSTEAINTPYSKITAFFGVLSIK